MHFDVGCQPSRHSRSHAQTRYNGSRKRKSLSHNTYVTLSLTQVDNCGKLLFFCLSVAGLVYQIVLISTSYFAYEAKSSVVMNMPEEEEIPSLTVCWRYADIIDMDKLRSINSAIPELDTTNDETIKNSIWIIQSLVTVKQILDMNPQLDVAFGDCIIRYPGNYMAQPFDVKKCQRTFIVARYFVQVRWPVI